MWPLLALLLAALALEAQTPAAFEVVSIKLRDKSVLPGMPRLDAGRISYPNISLKSLIMRAYDVKNYQINGPAWLDDVNQYSFTFSAKIPEGASAAQVPAMLQTMLADRFELRVHRESRMEPVYALVVGKGGAKLKKTTETRTGPDGRLLSTLDLDEKGHFIYTNATLDRFAQSLSVNVGRPILNKTGIDGNFDIEIDLNPADLAKLGPPDEVAEDSSNSGSVFTALAGLGLKLESRKAPIDHLIIDSALKAPTEN